MDRLDPSFSPSRAFVVSVCISEWIAKAREEADNGKRADSARPPSGASYQ